MLYGIFTFGNSEYHMNAKGLLGGTQPLKMATQKTKSNPFLPAKINSVYSNSPDVFENY